MKDLDFDELDKAVNSLMGGVKDKDPGDTSKTLDINTTLAPDEKPAYGNLTQVAGRIGSEAIDKQEKTVSLEEDVTPVTTPASSDVVEPKETPKVKLPSETPQRAGRFMDVVHPSSDMKRTASAKVSREGVTIAAPASIPEPEEDKEKEDVATKATPSDMSGNLPTSGAPEISTDETSDEKDPVEPATVETAAQEPLVSPFLPDAKVEKRPLGGEPPTGASEPDLKDTSAIAPLSAASVTAESAPSDTEDDSSVMDNIVTNPPKETEEDVTVHVPEEFKDELLAVEKNTDIVPGADAPSQDAPKEPILAASIPKQYQEKPSSTDTKSGAIYDTDAYHKPLAHPAKKSSGWLWVVGIVVIIALGAAAGAFVYFVGF